MATINPPWRLDPLQMIVNISSGGPATFVAIDEGFYAQSSANDVLSFADPNPGTNYDGGYNVYSSRDGINWTIKKQGVVNAVNPYAFWSTDQVPAGYTYSGTVTLYLNSHGVLPFQISYIGVITEEGGNPPLPPDVPPNNGPTLVDSAGTVALPPSVSTPPMVYPFAIQTAPSVFQAGIPGQPASFLTDYGFYEGFTVVAPTDAWGLANEITQAYKAWNLTDGLITALDGTSEYLTSSSVPTKVFITGGNIYSADSERYTNPFYYRSTDGVTWKSFMPPFNPTDPWFPSWSDSFLDDGTQRTMNGHPGQFDGAPTFLWFSFATYDGPLYESSDGCVTWEISSHYKAGNNPDTDNTDDVYIGDPNNALYSFPAEWTLVYGEVGGHGGARMGVTIDASGPGFPILHSGPADHDPSTWPARSLPVPQNVINANDAQNAFLLEEYTLGISGYTTQLEIAQNQLDACQAASTWATANGWAFAAEWIYIVTEMESLVSQIQAVIDGLPGPPDPQSPTLSPTYVAYAVPPGAGEGIFVCVGGGTNDVPTFWYSKDAVDWSVANYDFELTSDTFAVTPVQYLVSGNSAAQLFPETPT